MEYEWTSLLTLPKVPANHKDFIKHAAPAKTPKEMWEKVEPYKEFDTKIREVFAQQPDHPVVEDEHVNVVPVFGGYESILTIRARDLEAESEEEKSRYILPLKDEDRLAHGAPATVHSLEEFQYNFSVFSESSLVDIDWSNIVVAGSATLAALRPVPEKYKGSKKLLRQYFHEILAPASDVDLFLYGLTEEEAIEKIKHIEAKVKDAILVDSTTIRTKNAITIASKYPTRHVQIVLRIYKSVAEILTGFDVDSSCVAYDGKQVYAAPRALASIMTQINTVDLTRRSPSYENRLSKYSHRGFEVYWSHLDRSRIDPTIFERNIRGVLGLARLLMLERLPQSKDREDYHNERRKERGRPEKPSMPWFQSYERKDIKQRHEDEVAEWAIEDDIANYHTITIPYGPKFHARKIEKLLFKKDLLLNVEWNRPKDREVNLHRHPAFVGTAEEVMGDCCGDCPQPVTTEEKEIAEEESKNYISGNVQFLKDDPGRQAIGSFHPLNNDDWTEMAYVTSAMLLCQAITDHDIEKVRHLLDQEEINPNQRDYTGRTPLSLAVTSSTPEIVQTLIDAGAKLVARLVDGKTALHLAAIRGDMKILSSLMRQSEKNEEEYLEREDNRRKAKVKADSSGGNEDYAKSSAENMDTEMETDETEDVSDIEMRSEKSENSYVNVNPSELDEDDGEIPRDDEQLERDYFDPNVLDWDWKVSPLHLAIMTGHCEMVKALVQEYGHDPYLPVYIGTEHHDREVILPLALTLNLPMNQATAMIKTLMELGVSVKQGDSNRATNFLYCVPAGVKILQTLMSMDNSGCKKIVNEIAKTSRRLPRNPLITAIIWKDLETIKFLFSHGATPEIDFNSYGNTFKHEVSNENSSGRVPDAKRHFLLENELPIMVATRRGLIEIVKELLKNGADFNALSLEGYGTRYEKKFRYSNAERRETLLNVIESKITELEKYLSREDDQQRRPYHYYHRRTRRPLREDHEYFKECPTGSYAAWMTKVLLREEKDLRRKEDEPPEPLRPLDHEEQQAVEKRVSEWNKLKEELLAKGAKTYIQLYGESESSDKDVNSHDKTNKEKNQEPFEIPFFRNMMGPLEQTGYLRLFEAAWNGDLETIKELTLSIWKHPESGDQMQPLVISTSDVHNFCPFSLAVLRGHYAVARIIFQIAEAQYTPENHDRRRRYGIELTEAVDSDDDDDDDVNIFSEIVNENFTIQDVAEIATQVRSRTLPREMIHRNIPIELFTGNQDEYWKEHPNDLLTYSINEDDSKLLSLLVELTGIGTRESIINRDETIVDFGNIANASERGVLPSYIEDEGRYKNHWEHGFTFAFKHEKTEMLSQLIKQTGVHFPLSYFLRKHHITIQPKSKYYQGLSIHGAKRQDWTRNFRRHHPTSSEDLPTPPFLRAAKQDGWTIAQWGSSNIPKECYLHFLNATKDDERLQKIQAVEGGLEGMVDEWINTRKQLAISTAVLNVHPNILLGRVEYLATIVSESIDAKSIGGYTPLLLAYKRRAGTTAKFLINQGVDQTCRDHCGNNILHQLCRDVDDQLSGDNEDYLSGDNSLENMLSLIDPEILPTLFVERSSEGCGASTPFGLWVYWITEDLADVRRNFSSDSWNELMKYEKRRKRAIENAQIALKFSKGIELGLVDGSGETPLHHAIKCCQPGLVELILNHDRSLLLRENATGSTPLDVIRDLRLSHMVKGAPNIAVFRPVPEPPWNKGNIDERLFMPRVESPLTGVLLDSLEAEDLDKTWKICEDVAKQLQMEGVGRRLVSLHEANEVAQRLAQRKKLEEEQRGRYGRRYRRGGWEEGQSDEVSRAVDE